MDGAEVAVNCLCSARSCATCWCHDSELADGHRGECEYRRMAEVMEQLDAEEAIPSICQRGYFIPSTPRLELAFI